MKTPKISVIVPVYNTEKWLHRCVDSILAQTYTDFELLLIDDGSTDGSGEICDEYAEQDSRIRVFHKPNGGVSSARNLGLDNALGEWITFADSDDYVYPIWLDNFSPEADNYDLKCQGLKSNKPLISLEHFGKGQKYSFDYNGDILTLINLLFENTILGYLFLKIFKNSIISENHIRFNNNVKYREDELFFFQYSQFASRVYSSSEIGYLYFVPEWDRKYNNCECTPEFSKCIYDNAVRLGFEPGSDFRNYFANEYKTSLLKYLKTGDADRKQLTRELKQLVKREYKNIGLFPLTKFILRYDRTGLLSNPILRLHLSLKSD